MLLDLDSHNAEFGGSIVHILRFCAFESKLTKACSEVEETAPWNERRHLISLRSF